MIIDPKKHHYKEIYKLLIGSIVPRPIALVSSISADGIPNLAPFSFFNGVCSNPPIILFSTVVREGGRAKDTLSNIEATGEYVINIPTYGLRERMNLTSTDRGPDIDEFEAAGWTPAPSVVVRPPRVLESPISFECRVHQIVVMGEGPGGGAAVIGTVVHLHLSDAVYQDGKIDHVALDAIGRIGGPPYCRVTDVFSLPRPPAP